MPAAIPRAVATLPPVASQAFPPNARLRVPAQYKAVFDGGKRLNSPQLRLFALVRAEATEPRLGIAVSKKVDKRAVGRNRIKRMARELFRRERATLPAGDFVLIAQPGAKAVPLPELRAQLAQLLERARSLKPLPPTGTMPASADAPVRPHPNPAQES